MKKNKTTVILTIVLILGTLILVVTQVIPVVTGIVRERDNKNPKMATGEIEVVPEKLEAYLKYAAEVGRVSMATEPGVIALFSMQDKSDPCKVYILEVYADQQAYQAHIQTAHFRTYKEGTADMVRSLKLIDTIPLVMAEFVKKAQ